MGVEVVPEVGVRIRGGGMRLGAWREVGWLGGGLWVDWDTQLVKK